MAREAVRWWGAGSYHGGGDVSPVAGEVTDRGVVFEYGHVGADRVVFRHGDFPVDSIRGDGVHSTARAVAVSELV